MVKVSKIGLYLGEFKHNLTERNRLSLPKRIRVEIDGFEVILTRGFEPCIIGFDKNHWQDIAKQQLAIQINEPRGRMLRRELFSGAMIVELDSQGRIVLPDNLLEWSGLKGKVGEEVVIVGAGDHFELWERSKWLKFEPQGQSKS